MQCLRNHSNESQDVMLLDPAGDELGDDSANVSLCLMPSIQEVTQIELSGEMPPRKASEIMELCMAGCDKIHSMMISCLTDEVMASIKS